MATERVRHVGRAVGRVVIRRISTDAPPHLDRYLLESERVVVAVRRHPARVLEPVLTTVATLVVVLWATTNVSPDVRLLPDVLWVAWLVVLGRALWRLAEWQQDWFVATDTRLMLTYGILTRKVAMMPLMKVTDMSYNRSPLGRLLGYGEFVLESAGHDQAMRVVSWLPNPDELYRRICTEIFGSDPGRRLVPPEVAMHLGADAGDPVRDDVPDRNATVAIYDD